MRPGGTADVFDLKAKAAGELAPPSVENPALWTRSDSPVARATTWVVHLVAQQRRM